MNNTTSDKIISIIKEMKNVAELDLSQSFIEGGLLDSFDIINLITALENEFQISIPGEAIIPENLHSVSDLARLVQAQQELR